MAKKQAAKKARKPKAQPLPGMEDARIQALESVASEYAEIRDQRMELNADESKLKEKTRRLMKEHHKTVYKRNGIEIRIIEGEEDVKVRIRKPKAEESVEIGSGG